MTPCCLGVFLVLAGYAHCFGDVLLEDFFAQLGSLVVTDADAAFVFNQYPVEGFLL